MRDIAIGNQVALASARDKGIVPRGFFWITVKDRDTGAPQTFGLWTGDDTVTLPMQSGETGAVEDRTYVGGVNLKIGDIPRVSDLTIQTVDVSFSGVAPVCQQIVRGFDPRLSKVELHGATLDTETRAFSDRPEIDFLGEVNGAPIETAAAGGESIITLNIVSDAISMLTRTNPGKRSYQGQLKRDGDEWALYSNAVKTWSIPWGEKDANPASGSPSSPGFGGQG